MKSKLSACTAREITVWIRAENGFLHTEAAKRKERNDKILAVQEEPIRISAWTRKNFLPFIAMVINDSVEK